jgi:flavin reductase (DIM6/NTAB) family NADH-FMN oxidoreductase RutF
MQKEVPFAEAIRTKYPEQVALALARTPSGIVNPITLGWVMPTSHAPPMVAISVGLTRYSLEVLRKAGEFVLCFPSTEQAEETLYFGTTSGRVANKLEARRTATQAASKIDACLVADAVANFECVVVGELLSGDHVIFVGEVVASHVNTEGKKRLYTVAPGHRLGGVACVRLDHGR